MSMPVQQTKKSALVPVWIVESDNPALARMTRRPVLIAIDELELTMRGQAMSMTMTHAQLKPEGQFYLCKDIYVEISFRFEATRYTLAGVAHPSSANQGFRMEFDTVARKTIAGMGEVLQLAGLLEATQPQPATPPELAARPLDKGAAPAPRPVEQNRIRKEPPPDGVERRAQPRFEVESPARLTLVEEARQTECGMIDLSLNGCRLHFKKPHELRKGQQVEVQFIGDGLPLRLAAVVQSAHSAQTVGLRFVSIGVRMQERLEWLVSEVAQGRAIAHGKK